MHSRAIDLPVDQHRLALTERFEPVGAEQTEEYTAAPPEIRVEGTFETRRRADPPERTTKPVRHSTGHRR
jgi:hypothetical protein